jgi:hypothetical protein
MLTDRLKEAAVQYLTDSKGQRTAVVVEIDAWNALLEALEDIEDAEEMTQARDERDDLIPWEQVVREYKAEHPDAQV